MTTKEFRDLYDSLFYGHEAELKYDGRCFYLEQNGMRATLYELDGDVAQPLKKIIAATSTRLHGTSTPAAKTPSSSGQKSRQRFFHVVGFFDFVKEVSVDCCHFNVFPEII